jgi:hypothetical protein
MMSMSRTIRYAVGLAVVLSISAPVAAQAGRPDNLRWKGQDIGLGGSAWGPQVGPTRGPMTQTTHRNELVLGGAVNQPATVVRVAHTGGGDAFDWTAALVGAAAAVGIVLVAFGGAAAVRSRRRVAIS